MSKLLSFMMPVLCDRKASMCLRWYKARFSLLPYCLQHSFRLLALYLSYAIHLQHFFRLFTLAFSNLVFF